MLKWLFGFVLFFAAGAQSETQKLTFELAVRADGELGRVASKAMKDILAKEKIDLTVTDFPARRGLEELKNGRIDGSVGRVGDIAASYGIKDILRVDFPIATVTISLWCSKNMKPHQSPIKLGKSLGAAISTTLAQFADQSRVQVQDISGFQNMMQMMKNGRLDCFMTNEFFLLMDGVDQKELTSFTRHDLVTSQAFPWISTRHARLKPIIEKGLREYNFAEDFRRRYQSNLAICSQEFDMLCPDGEVFTRKVSLKQVKP